MGIRKPIAKVRCIGCDNQSAISAVFRKWGVCNGKRLCFTMFRCGCGTYNVCQIDSDETIKIVDTIKSCFAKLSNGSVDRKVSARGKKAQRALEVNRKLLNKNYEGKQVKFEDENITLPNNWRICDVV